MTDQSDLPRAPIDAPTRRRLVFAAVAGTTLEWYDFMFYGTLAALVLGDLFFPGLDPTAARLAAFGTFGIAFVARPLGAVLFGFVADRFGRKVCLTWTILLMGFATLAMGLLPTYETVGVSATVLLVALRFAQGMAVGGEWGGAATLLLEHAPEDERGRFTGWAQAGGLFGPTLGSIVILGLNMALTDAEMLAWGWRVPFLLSAVLVVLGFYIRRSIPESAVFEELAQTRPERPAPLVAALRHGKRSLALVFFMYVAQVTMTYLSLTFAVAYATDRGFSTNQALVAVVIAGLVGCTLATAGRLSDRVGYRRVYVAGCLAVAVAAFPIFALVNSGSFLLLALALSLGFGLSSLLYMMQGVLFTELFQAGHRATGASVGVQLGSILGGGLAPTTATALVALDNGGSRFLCCYIAAVGIAGAVAAHLARTTTQGKVPGRLVEQSDGSARL